MLTYTNQTQKYKYQVNSGIILYGVNIEHIENADEMNEFIKDCIKKGEGFAGPTGGGITFNAVPELIDLKSDGDMYSRKKKSLIKKWNIKLEVVFIDFKLENVLELLLGSSLLDISEKRKLINIMDSKVLELPNLVWIGDIIDGGLICIELKNAICVNGFSLQTKKDGEGEMKAIFEPYSGSGFDPNEPPFSIIFLS